MRNAFKGRTRLISDLSQLFITWRAAFILHAFHSPHLALFRPKHSAIVREEPSFNPPELSCTDDRYFNEKEQRRRG